MGWQQYKDLSNKERDDGGEGGLKNVQNCVTSYMDGP